MKKWIAVLMVVCLLFAAAAAEKGIADEDNTSSGRFTYKGAAVDSDNLTVKLTDAGGSSGSGTTAAVKIGSGILLPTKIKKMTKSGKVDYSFIFDTDRLPEIVWVYPDGDVSAAIQLWPGDDAAQDRPGDGAAPVPAATPRPTVRPTATPKPTPKPTPTPAPAADVDDLLDYLGKDAYRDAWEHVDSGESFRSGSKGAPAKGLQSMLVAFGQDISVDGSVGPKTINALKTVQEAYGLEKTDTLDADGFEKLLVRLVAMKGTEKSYTLVSSFVDGDEYDYIRACEYYAQGMYASARYLFQDCSWGDAQKRADACIQTMPKSGVLYRNPDVRGTNTQLCIKVEDSPNTGMYVKVYTTKGVLARTMFIKGSSQTTVSMPAGTYVVKTATGSNWYGEEEAFGKEGRYQIMTSSSGEQEFQFQKDYIRTFKFNVKEIDPNASSLGSDRENWGDF